LNPMCSDSKYLVMLVDVARHGAPNRPRAGAGRVRCEATTTSSQVGFPIRTSRDQRVLSPPPGLSQSATSFIASCCQGIHQTPLSRLIRSRRRQALLYGGGSPPTRRRFLWSEVVDPAALPRQRMRRGSRAPDDLSVDRSPRSVSFDLERLSSVSYRLRLLEDVHPRTAGRSDLPVPHSERTRRRLVFRSLHDVSTCRHLVVSLARSDRKAHGPCACQSNRLRPRGLVGRGGVEPPTSRLSGVRSNHLSYRPLPLADRRLVEPTGIEPVTSCLQSTRSPS
jgi:hypothetical protein